MNEILAIVEKFKTEINEIKNEKLSDFNSVELGIKISRKCMQELRIKVRQHEFTSNENEIHFFKHIKPSIYSKIKFFSKLYQFLLARPQGSIKKQRSFIDAEIEKLQRDYKENLDFVKYYREGSTYLDRYYFLRGKDEVQLITDTSHYLTDAEFSTSHDNLVAKIMAYDLLINHYQKLLQELRFTESQGQQSPYGVLGHYTKRGFKWTGSKTDLIELIYGLQASGAIEDGTAAINAMVNACEELFELELGNPYRTFLEIKERKKDQTKFLDEMKIALQQKMEREV